MGGGGGCWKEGRNEGEGGREGEEGRREGGPGVCVCTGDEDAYDEGELCERAQGASKGGRR